jgi:cation-transporting ATPase 13A3/4/5
MDPYDILNAASTQQKIGLSHAQHLSRLISFGSNHIDTRKTPPLQAIFRELRKPIYLFQLLVFTLWISKGYYIYACLFLLLVVISFTANVLQKNDSKKIIKKLIKTYGPEVRVLRDEQSFMVGSASLVPGDLVQITGRITLPCDLVLIDGTMEIDESTITGDTEVAQKVSYTKSENRTLPTSLIQLENTLIGGTRIKSVKNALAVVIRTGFNTSRGRVLRQLLSQKQDTHSDYSLSHLIITFIISSFFNLISSVLYRTLYLKETTSPPISYVDLFVCTIPPFLPLVLIMPLYIAKRRLKKSNIKCTSLLGLMKMGTVDCICYDKTGTMTQDSLSLYGTVEAKSGSFGPVRETVMDMNHWSVGIMAACHNLNTVNDVVLGDPLEEALFKRTGYDLKRIDEQSFMVHPPPMFNDRGTIQVVNTFPFSSTLRRMSVMTRIPNCCVYTKGSPSSIKSICQSSKCFDFIFTNYSTE